MMKKIQGRIAVVTGAGSGIGRATAIALAEAGCEVAVVDIDAKSVVITRELVEGVGGVARQYVVDVSDGAAMEALAAEVAGDFGEIHIIVNNAGVSVTARFEEHTVEDFERVLGVNLWGVIHGCRVFLPHLREVDEGHIVNISSAFGIVAGAGQAAYSASKFGVRALSETLHEELADTAIGVSVVHPGCIKTNIVAASATFNAEVRDKAIDYFERRGALPDVVAKRIVRAIERGEHRVRVTPETYIFDWVRRVAPQRGNRLANVVMGKMLGIDPGAI